MRTCRDSGRGTANLNFHLVVAEDVQNHRSPILIRGEPAPTTSMVERRIKPYQEQLAEAERRNLQRRAFRRNQAFGLLIVAAAILIWWLFHTNPRWIFPPGWWRP